MLKLIAVAFFALSTLSFHVNASDCNQQITHPNIIRTHAPIFGLSAQNCNNGTEENIDGVGGAEQVGISLLNTLLPNGRVGELYSFDFKPFVKWSNLPEGSPEPSISWSVVNSLPAGLTLDSSTGVISGVPTNTGSSSFEIQAASGTTGSKVYSVVIRGAISIAIADAEIPSANVGSQYSYDFNNLIRWHNIDEDEEKPEVVWSANSLPDGLSLTSEGFLSGAPSSASSGQYEFIAETGGVSASKVFTILVEDGLPLKAIHIATGMAHGCAVTPEHTVKCWGWNLDYQLGDGTNLNRYKAVDVPGLTEVAKVYAGYNHSCAIKSNGDVYCWGSNAYGQLGESGGAKGAVVKARINIPVKDLALGSKHSCALTTTNTLYCWGYNYYGQVGKDGTTETSVTLPYKLSLSGVDKIVADNNHTCALTSAGGVKCWGYNSNWELGRSQSTASRYSPMDVTNLTSGVIDISAGGLHNCAVKNTGDVVCWGYNQSGDLGRGSNSPKEIATANVAGIQSNALRVHSGQYYSCAELSNNGVRCWGNGGSGVFANGVANISNVSVEATGLNGHTQLSLGNAFACAIFGGGDVKCWGANIYGSVGDGSTEKRVFPVSVKQQD